MRWVPLERRSSKPAPSSARSASTAVKRGSLGIHFEGCRQNLPAEQVIAFVARQRLEVELDRFRNMGHSLLEGVTLEHRARGSEGFNASLHIRTKPGGYHFRGWRFGVLIEAQAGVTLPQASQLHVHVGPRR